MEEIDKFSLEKLKVELRKRNAKLSGRKSELLERLKNYISNESYQFIEPEGVEKMVLPPKQDYKDINASCKVLAVNENMITSYLSSHEQCIRKKAQLMYDKHFLLYVQSTNGYIKASVSASMRKLNYEVNILVRNDAIVECQCECPVGMYTLFCKLMYKIDIAIMFLKLLKRYFIFILGAWPTAHCKHVQVVLLGLESFTKTKTIKMYTTCTEKLQTFHHPRGKFKGSPMKADMIGASISRDTGKKEMDMQYSAGVLSSAVNYAIQEKEEFPLLQMVTPADPRAMEVEHDYVEKLEGDELLIRLQLTKVSIYEQLYLYKLSKTIFEH